MCSAFGTEAEMIDGREFALEERLKATFLLKIARANAPNSEGKYVFKLRIMNYKCVKMSEICT